VIDLTSSPPRLIDTVTVGKQPSGMSINRAGNLALVTNRADNSISVLSIDGKQVKVIDTVVIGEQVAHVAFTPDGTRALAAKFPGHKAALLEVAGQKVTYTKRDLPVGLWPYNLDVTPDGRLALTADNGNAGFADGNIEEYNISVSGNSAETSTGGVRINLIPREGSNSFRGAFFGNYASPDLQATNNTDALRSRGLFDAGTRQFDIAFDVSANPAVRPGVSAAIAISGAAYDNVLFVPRTAVFDVSGRPTVYVRSTGGFDAHEVRVRAWTDSVAVVENIEPAAEVALVNPNASSGTRSRTPPQAPQRAAR